MCVETQTDATIIDGKIVKDSSYKNPPPVGKGKYPCKIGNCTEELPHGRMLPHIRFYHNDSIIMVLLILNILGN